MLEKIFIHRDVLTEQNAKHNDIGPAVMITNEQIPVFFAKTFQPFDVPLQSWIEVQK